MAVKLHTQKIHTDKGVEGEDQVQGAGIKDEGRVRGTKDEIERKRGEPTQELREQAWIVSHGGGRQGSTIAP